MLESCFSTYWSGKHLSISDVLSGHPKIPNGQDMSRDLSGKLLCGAAVPVRRDGEADSKRAVALAEAGANVLYLFGDGVDAQLELCLGNGNETGRQKNVDECEGTNQHLQRGAN